jgi:hypothetical protein
MSDTADNELLAIDPTDAERYFMYMALTPWGGLASNKPLPLTILGVSDWAEFDALTDRLARTITEHEELFDVDWARALFLTEISWASDLVGAATWVLERPPPRLTISPQGERERMRPRFRDPFLGTGLRSIRRRSNPTSRQLSGTWRGTQR